MTSSIDYSSVTIPNPTEKPRSEWHYTERRAAILELIKEKPHPRAINQRALAREFDISEAQISKDMKVLREFIVENIDETRVAATTEALYERAISEHADRGEWDKVVRAIESWNEWLGDRGYVETEPDRHEISGPGGDPLAVSITNTAFNPDDYDFGDSDSDEDGGSEDDEAEDAEAEADE